MKPPKYLVDTNVILRRSKHEDYDETLFFQYWKNFDKLVSKGIIISTPSVFKEIEALDKEMYDWAKKHDYMFQSPPDDEFRKESNIIKNILKGWYYRKKEGVLWADRDLVIHAKAYNMVLVTQETPNLKQKKPKKYKIPMVCLKLGAYCRCGKEYTDNVDANNAPFQCINFSELVRREKLYKRDFVR